MFLGHAQRSDGIRIDAQGNSVIKETRQALKRRVSSTRAAASQKSRLLVSYKHASKLLCRAYERKSAASEGQTTTKQARRVAAVDKGGLRVSSSHIASCSSTELKYLYSLLHAVLYVTQQCAAQHQRRDRCRGGPSSSSTPHV